VPLEPGAHAARARPHARSRGRARSTRRDAGFGAAAAQGGRARAAPAARAAGGAAAMTAPATITLTTDFGTRDSYVAQIKGVLLATGPVALRIVDLGHEIAPQDVREAAFFLRCAVPRFAPGTIHLAVIDPGVGSARRPIAV